MKIRFGAIATIFLLVYFSLQAQAILPSEEGSAHVLIQKADVKAEDTMDDNTGPKVESITIRPPSNKAQDYGARRLDGVAVKFSLDNVGCNDSYPIINVSIGIVEGSSTQKVAFHVNRDVSRLVVLTRVRDAQSPYRGVRVLTASLKKLKPPFPQAFAVEDSAFHGHSFIDFLELQISIKLPDGQVYHLTITLSLLRVGRISETDVLSNKRRRRIYEYLKRHPGTYLREIMRHFSLGVHAVKWHLSVLERSHLIGHNRCGRYLIFYPTENRPSNLQVRIRIALLNKNTAKVLGTIASNPGISPTNLCQQLKLHKNTASYHTKKLLKLGLIHKYQQYKGNVRLFITKKPA